MWRRREEEINVIYYIWRAIVKVEEVEEMTFK